MLPTLAVILLATFAVSLASLVGIFFISLKGTKKLQKTIDRAVSFAIGALLSTVFCGMLHHLVEEGFGYKLVIVGILLSLLIEKIIHWRHHHGLPSKEKPFGYINLIGDALHNFVDGFVIASSFLVSSSLGFITTLSIIFHEIPQEIGDFFVLLKANFTIKKALLFNFLVALTAILGSLFGYFVGVGIKGILPYMIAIGAGNLLYIAMTDLMPEIIEEDSKREFAIKTILMIIGLLIVYYTIRVL